MEKTPTKYKINPAREHTRAIMMSIDKLSKSLETSRHNPLDDVSKFLGELNNGLQKLLEISDRQVSDGEPGVSVTEAKINGKNLVLTLSNKKEINVGKVVGEDGFDGDDADENKIIKKILAQIPKPKQINEEEMIKKFLAKIPKQERVTAQDIIKVIKDKKALSYHDLKDLPDIVKLIRKYTAHLEERLNTRIVPGGNTLRALLDVKWDTATANTKYLRPVFLNGEVVGFEFGTPPGSGGGMTLIDVTGTIDDSNTTFSCDEPTYVVINGIWYKATGGPYTWSWAGGTLTLSGPIGTGSQIWAFA